MKASEAKKVADYENNSLRRILNEIGKDALEGYYKKFYDLDEVRFEDLKSLEALGYKIKYICIDKKYRDYVKKQE